MLRILARNIISNWCGFAVQAAVAFFLTPFVLDCLGDTRYGIWALVTGLTGYYGLLDLGFRSGITQYLARHLATRDFEQMNRVASTAIVALGACGWVIVAVSGGLCWLAPKVFAIPAAAVSESRWCILIIGVSTAISFIFFTFSAVFAATQRYDMANAIAIGIRLVTAVAMVGALKSGYGLLGLSVVSAAGDILGYVLRMHVAFRIVPQLKIALRTASRQNLWAITTFGLWTVAVDGAIQVKTYASTMMIGLFLPIAALAPFSLASGLLGYLTMVLGPMATVFFPAATHLDASGDKEGLRQMYLKGSKMLLLFSVTSATIGAVWARDFFGLWVGPRLVEGTEYPSIVVLFLLLIGGTTVTTSQRIGYQVLLATRRTKSLASLLALEAMASVILSLCLIRQYGLVGVCVATLAPAIVFQGFLHPLVVCRLLDISGSTYLRGTLLRACSVGAIQAGLFTAIHTATPPSDSWPLLIGYGLLSGTASIPLIIFIGLDQIERHRLFVRPLTHLTGWLKSSNRPRSRSVTFTPTSDPVLDK